jgi:hypothetical protein
MHHTAQDKTVIGSNPDEIEADYYFRGAPVSLYCTNIAWIMGSRSNPWHHGRRRSGITYKDGTPVPLRAFNDHVSYNDGKLEFATFSSMFGIMFQRTSRVYQSDGSF